MIPLFKNPVWSFAASPVSMFYGLGIFIRNLLYERSVFKVNNLKTPVISIGNISVGGTGKTPLVEYAAKYLLQIGCKPAIISRGYKRKSDEIITVFDGTRFLVSSPMLSGDEPYLLARHLQDIPIVVGKNRYDAGIYTQNLFKPDVIILDDAFQHRNLKRDLDIVVIDSTNPWGNGSLLPGGPMREPKSSLKRADIVIISRVNESESIEKIVKNIAGITSAPIVLTGYKPDAWIGLNNRTKHIDSFINEPVLAFTGTGNPNSFKRTLNNTGVKIVDFLSFRDHHWFTKKEITSIVEIAESKGAKYLVTTEKDIVRLLQFEYIGLPVYSLRISVDIHKGKDYFSNALEKTARIKT